MTDYSTLSYDDLYGALNEAEERLMYLAMCPNGIQTEEFNEAQAIVDAIYDEIERREDLFR